MAFKFIPSGFLDVQTDPLMLPGQMEAKTEVSNAMTRCTNLHLDDAGMAVTRAGILRVSSAAITPPDCLIELAGNRYEFAGSKVYLNESIISSDQTNAEWSGVAYKAFNAVEDSVFALNGTDRVRITGSDIAQWGIDAPTVSPTTNGPTGTVVEIVITYVRKVGAVNECESNPSPVVENDWDTWIAPLWPGKVYWTAPSDPQITHVRIYRSLQNTPGTWYFDSEWAVSLLQGTLQCGLDERLGTACSTDHDRPPLGTVVFGPNFAGVLFIIVDNLLYYTSAAQPEYCPATNYVEVSPPDDPLVAGCVFAGAVYVASKYAIYQIQGTGVSTFYPLPTVAVTGTQAKRCFLPVAGQGLLHLGYDGIYSFNMSGDTKITDNRFAPIFQGTTVGSLPGLKLSLISSSWLYLYEGRAYFGYCGLSDSYPQNMLRISPQSGKTTHYQYGLGLITGAIDKHNNRWLMADLSGYVWTIEDISQTTDSGTVIAWQIQTKDFGGQLRKVFPRWSRYDVELVNGCTATASILLNDVSGQDHIISASRKTTKRLITTCSGERVSIRVAGTGPVKIHSMELE